MRQSNEITLEEIYLSVADTNNNYFHQRSAVRQHCPRTSADASGIDAFDLRKILKMKNGEHFNRKVTEELIEDFGNHGKINFNDFERLWTHIGVRLDEFEHFANGNTHLTKGWASYINNQIRVELPRSS